jgi:hypothetical protein
MPDNLIPHSVTDPKNQPQVKETYLAGACPVFATDAVRIPGSGTEAHIRFVPQ